MNQIKRFRGGATWIALIVAIAALWLIVRQRERRNVEEGFFRGR